MWISLKYLFLSVCGVSFGMLAAAGVFTVLVAVGLVPRFAGRTHTADKVVLYEDMVIAGTVVGGFASVFERYAQLGNALISLGVSYFAVQLAGTIFTVIFGVFAGAFIGCLALAIAEMLDSIPIFSRRIGFRHGIGIVICSMAAGKLVGSLLYFFLEMHEWIS